MVHRLHSSSLKSWKRSTNIALSFQKSQESAEPVLIAAISFRVRGVGSVSSASKYCRHFRQTMTFLGIYQERGECRSFAAGTMERPLHLFC